MSRTPSEAKDSEQDEMIAQPAKRKKGTDLF